MLDKARQKTASGIVSWLSNRRQPRSTVLLQGTAEAWTVFGGRGGELHPVNAREDLPPCGFGNHGINQILSYMSPILSI